MPIWPLVIGLVVAGGALWVVLTATLVFLRPADVTATAPRHGAASSSRRR